MHTCLSVYNPQHQAITCKSYFLCVLMILLVWACAHGVIKRQLMGADSLL